MGSFVLTDCTVFVDGYDFTTDLNQLSLVLEVEEQEVTTFGGNGFRSRIGGLKNVAADLSGFWQSDTAAAVDPQIFSKLDGRSLPVIITPAGEEAGPAYLFQAGHFSYEILGGIGEVAPFSVSMQGTSGTGLIRGELAAAATEVTGAGALGSVLNLGPVASGQSLYCVFQVFEAGTTITIDLESDDNSGMTTATTRTTIGPLTATGGTWVAAVAGPITDTHYRLNVTAATGTFSVAGAIGIR